MGWINLFSLHPWFGIWSQEPTSWLTVKLHNCLQPNCWREFRRARDPMSVRPHALAPSPGSRLILVKSCLCRAPIFPLVILGMTPRGTLASCLYSAETTRPSPLPKQTAKLWQQTVVRPSGRTWGSLYQWLKAPWPHDLTEARIKIIFWFLKRRPA